MIEILVICVATLFLAHRKGSGRRRRYSLRKVRVTPEIALLTLASDVALSVAGSGASDAVYRAISMQMTWTYNGATGGDGPITVGYCHSDYSVAEIKECLEAQAAVATGNKIALEQSNRLVRIVGTIRAVANAGSALNDGKPIKTRLNWLITVGDQVNFFAFNENTAALTTGGVINAVGNMWVKDSV